MVKWYYVQGAERIGPVGVEILQELFQQGELNLDSYVWKKGFENWEHIKNVNELDFLAGLNGVENSTEELHSPEIDFTFEWTRVREDDELFFIKIGSDRKHSLDQNYFGPYSIRELRDALFDKRINNHTLIFSAGMPGWIEIGETPLDPKNLSVCFDRIKDRPPLFLLVDYKPLPIMVMINKAGKKDCQLLGAGHFEVGNTLNGSMYLGDQLKGKNIRMTIHSYHPKEQILNCKFIDIDDASAKTMINYVE